MLHNIPNSYLTLCTENGDVIFHTQFKCDKHGYGRQELPSIDSIQESKEWTTISDGAVTYE